MAPYILSTSIPTFNQRQGKWDSIQLRFFEFIRLVAIMCYLITSHCQFGHKLTTAWRNFNTKQNTEHWMGVCVLVSSSLFAMNACTNTIYRRVCRVLYVTRVLVRKFRTMGGCWSRILSFCVFFFFCFSVEERKWESTSSVGVWVGLGAVDLV